MTENVIKLYDVVKSTKPQNERKSRKRSAITTREETIEEASTENLECDEYGCVSYQVPLPDGESLDTQEIKRSKLLQNLENSPINENEIDELVKITFATQRKSIIERKSMSEVILLWPHLKITKYFLAHSNTLFGKDMKNIWEEKLGSKGVDLFKYFEKAVLQNNQGAISRD